MPNPIEEELNNLPDVIRFYTASIKYQDNLIVESTNNPITQIATEINVPVYFVMGKYDGIKEFILFEESVHYPQFEEKQKFHQWMKNTFK